MQFSTLTGMTNTNTHVFMLCKAKASPEKDLFITFQLTRFNCVKITLAEELPNTDKSANKATN